MATLDEVFQKCRSSKRPAFIPFVTAGDPSLEKTGSIIDALIQAGADVIEIGFPYSDPLADGPVIQASYTRALGAQTKLSDIFTHAANWTKRYAKTAFVAMVSYSLVYRTGTTKFLDAARTAGLNGLIIPDLPHEEASKLSPQAQSHQLALIQLVTPTTPKDRAQQIALTSSGFLYVVSITGITGTRTELPAQLTQQLSELRQMTQAPLCVGFGVSSPEQVSMLREHVDGVIVGSALVKCLEGDLPFEQKLTKLSNLATQLRTACG